LLPVAAAMNIFRLTGLLSHLAAIVILLLKIWKTRSCAGERPGEAQEAGARGAGAPEGAGRGGPRPSLEGGWDRGGHHGRRWAMGPV
jgi:hypothetical protein